MPASATRAYIAMEMLKGRDLRQLRQEGLARDAAQAALIVRRVADALALPTQGRDPPRHQAANIFMVGPTQPRVLDFGIARIAHSRTQRRAGRRLALLHGAEQSAARRRTAVPTSSRSASCSTSCSPTLRPFRASR
jgi:hypothetical protein